MKIEYDEEGFEILDDYTYRYKTDIFVKLGKGWNYYVYKGVCRGCGDPYFMHKYKPTDFCSASCAISGASHYNYGKNLSSKTRKRISKSSIGEKSSQWKGGISELDIPLFDTYAHQISYVEGVRRNPKNPNWLQVRCTYCKKWFSPKMTAVGRRAFFLKGELVSSEQRFYCSNKCKALCPVFGQHKYPKGQKPYYCPTKSDYYAKTELNIWREEVLKRADYKCEYCGGSATVAHHERPKKLEPFFALDPDYGIACCEECHYKYGHQGDCSTSALAFIVCK